MVIKLFGVQAIRLLDLGSGSGIISRKYIDSQYVSAAHLVDKYRAPILSSFSKTVFTQKDLLLFLDEYSGEPFHFVLLIDILEHFSIYHITEIFARLEPHVVPGGIVCIQFPNGDSPFSLRNFNNDSTHVTWLGSDLFLSLVPDCFTPVSIQPIFDFDYSSRLASCITFVARLFFVYPLLSLLLFGKFNRNILSFWSPNLGVVLRKKS